MKLGVLTTSYPRDADDTAGRFVHDFTAALTARGHAATVLAPEPPERGAASASRTSTTTKAASAIEVVHVPYLRPSALQTAFYGSGALENVARSPSAALGLATFPVALTLQAARSLHDCDALLSHWALPCVLAAGVVRRRRPHLAVFHSGDLHVLARLPGRRALAQRIEATATALWFVSTAGRDLFFEALGREARLPVVLRPMGPEPLASTPTREHARRALGVSGFVVLSMGRLEPIKGLDTLLDAVAATPGATLLCAGEGAERERLATRARRLGIDARFLGNVRGEQKANVLAAADAFVLASRTLSTGRAEGAPVALVEAMHAGLPAVATNTGGVAELLSDAGLLVAPGDAASIGASLRALRDDAPLASRLAAAARARSVAFDWATTAARAEALLEG